MLIAVADQSQVAAARRASTAIAREMGFDEEKTGRVALIATEMATNILKHASLGDVIVQRFTDETGTGVEVLATDKGPGIRDIGRSLEDGYSTTGTPGTGLGSIRRQADFFDIFSRPGLGTAVMARIRGDKSNLPAAPSNGITIGAVIIPYPGEIESGDSWAFENGSSGATLLAVDGSGHGPLAAAAARAAVTAFEKNHDADGVHLVEFLHRALAPTRGAALAIARFDMSARAIRFTGVGNITGALVSAGTIKRMVSHNGTAGHVAPRIREFIYPFDKSPTVILHSDGISTKWDLSTYPGLVTHHPSVIAAMLCRDHRRGHDDALVAVMRVDI